MDKDALQHALYTRTQQLHVGLGSDLERGKVVMGVHFICDMARSYGGHDSYTYTQKLYGGLGSALSGAGLLWGSFYI